MKGEGEVDSLLLLSNTSYIYAKGIGGDIMQLLTMIGVREMREMRDVRDTIE